MTINRTTLLDLPLPVTGTESGVWGDVVNNGLSQYIDISVAGSLSLSADSDTNLSSTEGDASATNIGSTTAQYAILRCTGARTATRNINAPAWAISGGTLTNYSKIYIVVNETTGSQNIVLRATNSATPTYTTGVTIVPGERAVCAWNGSDFVKVGGAAGGSTTQIQFNNAGVFGGSANLTWDGTNVQIGATGALRLADTDSSNYVAFKSPGTVASNVTWTLPSADGTNGQALTTNGSGTLAFSSVTTSPGGSTTQVQYNNAGAFGGSANFVFDGTNVGIGTSSPSSFYSGARKLVVGGASGEQGLTIYSGDNFGYLMFATGTSGTNPYSGQVRYDQPTLSMQVVNFQNGPLQFLTNNTERMRITSSGALLAGLTSSVGTNPLRVQSKGGAGGTAPYAGYAVISGNDEVAGYINLVSSSENSIGIHADPENLRASSSLQFNVDGTERMRIDSSGNVGIGVTPSAWGSFAKALQIGSRTAVYQDTNDAIFSNNTYGATGGNTYIATAAATQYYQSAGTHVWRSAPSGTAGTTITFTELMRIDSSGNVGVGVTPPTVSQGRLLSLAYSGSGISVTSGTSLDLTNNAYYNSGWKYGQSGKTARIQLSDDQIYFGNATTGTAGNAITFTQTLAIQQGKTLALEGASLQTGTGITFPATQSASSDANTLDDYEEGTWTPSLGGNTTYSNQTGTYTKIGRQVTVKCRLAVTSIGTGSTRTISGLPFTPGENASSTAPYFDTVSTNIVYLTFLTNSTTLDAYSATAATGTLTGAANPIFKNGTTVEFYCTYFV